MKKSLLLVVSLAASVAFGQSWEKPFVPGVTYRMEIDNVTPRVTHILRINLDAPDIRVRAEVAGGRVFSPLEQKGRETLSSMLARTGAAAALNADFFPWAGDPLGAMVNDSLLYSTPDPRRAVIGWGSGGVRVGKLRWNGALESPELGSLPLNGVNEEAPENGVVAFTDGAYQAVAKGPSRYLVCEPLAATAFTPDLSAEFAVRSVVTDQEALGVERGSLVIAARGTAAEKLKSLGVGSSLKLNWRTQGFDWKKISHVIGGGNMLVRGGKVAIDAKDAGFGADFSEKRHPRSAVGITASGDLIWLATDGRQKVSDGATLSELAQLMLAQGCTDAINLDGGGSTALALRGLVANRPSDGKERPVANALLLFGPKVTPDPEAATWRVLAPLDMKFEEAVNLSIVDKTGLMIPPREILWTASGAGWIDQSGTLRGLSGGVASVRAYVRGTVFSVEINVAGPPAPAPQIPPAAKPPKQ
ncbi:MAG: phosphodiester glycosidase family protein [Chthonomonas sp.]|nr:phosphodiester glycosidase family protein [Chthonomonas sp.]